MFLIGSVNYIQPSKFLECEKTGEDEDRSLANNNVEVKEIKEVAGVVQRIIREINSKHRK